MRYALPADPEAENARRGELYEGPSASVRPGDSALLACSHGSSLSSPPFACPNLRWGLGTLPQQTDVYVPRRLSHVAGDIIAILREAHQAVEQARARGSTALDAELLGKLRQRYDEAAAFALTSDNQVIAAVQQQLDEMRAAGYHRSEILGSEVTVLNSTSALYRQAFSRHRRDGGEISRLTATYLVTDGPIGRRISALAIHSP